MSRCYKVRQFKTRKPFEYCETIYIRKNVNSFGTIPLNSIVYKRPARKHEMNSVIVAVGHKPCPGEISLSGFHSMLRRQTFCAIFRNMAQSAKRIRVIKEKNERTVRYCSASGQTTQKYNNKTN